MGRLHYGMFLIEFPRYEKIPGSIDLNTEVLNASAYIQVEESCTGYLRL
jgi:hypothetical protein